MLARRIPKRLFAVKKFTIDHEWVELKGDVATVGITDYAQKALGDVVYVELPGKNKELKKKDTLGAVESVKAASDVYAPLSGKVVDINTNLEGEVFVVFMYSRH